jgi:hypothetical protein
VGDMHADVARILLQCEVDLGVLSVTGSFEKGAVFFLVEELLLMNVMVYKETDVLSRAFFCYYAVIYFTDTFFCKKSNKNRNV